MESRREKAGLASQRVGFARIGRHVGPPSRFLILNSWKGFGTSLDQNPQSMGRFSATSRCKGNRIISEFMERVMGIELTFEGWVQLKGFACNLLGVLSCRSQPLKANGRTFGPLPSPDNIRTS